ncbi:protein Star-like [Homarus americanus]|uniref:Star-like 4 n=1 Tax=Homarus americanus TaxID=6706 RepID=A0A8J5J684_HOMAM|nr:protein Star-like [Homarus americanus]KAG7153375.1 Star-like 4 [Homarus americanus]
MKCNRIRTIMKRWRSRPLPFLSFLLFTFILSSILTPEKVDLLDKFHQSKSTRNPTSILPTQPEALTISDNHQDESKRKMKKVEPTHTLNHPLKTTTLPELQQRNFEGTADGDPDLVSYLRKYKLRPPSKEPYRLSSSNSRDYSLAATSPALEELLHDVKNGFFVEVGGYDGEYQSNTLSFEKYLNWTGLLIEANPDLYQKLIKRNRKAYTIESCVSLQPYVTTVRFMPKGVVGRINKNGTLTVQCYPLHSILLALNRTYIDLFSLDIEGDEFWVLKTIPFDKMEFRVIVVEVKHIAEGPKVLTDFMLSKGYIFLKTHHINVIYGKKELFPAPVASAKAANVAAAAAVAHNAAAAAIKRASAVTLATPN